MPAGGMRPDRPSLWPNQPGAGRLLRTSGASTEVAIEPWLAGRQSTPAPAAPRSAPDGLAQAVGAGDVLRGKFTRRGAADAPQQATETSTSSAAQHRTLAPAEAPDSRPLTAGAPRRLQHGGSSAGVKPNGRTSNGRAGVPRKARSWVHRSGGAVPGLPAGSRRPRSRRAALRRAGRHGRRRAQPRDRDRLPLHAGADSASARLPSATACAAPRGIGKGEDAPGRHAGGECGPHPRPRWRAPRAARRGLHQIGIAAQALRIGVTHQQRACVQKLAAEGDLPFARRGRRTAGGR